MLATDVQDSGPAVVFTVVALGVGCILLLRRQRQRNTEAANQMAALLTCRLCWEDSPDGMLIDACACRGEGEGVHIECAARACVAMASTRTDVGVCGVCNQRYGFAIKARAYQLMLEHGREVGFSNHYPECFLLVLLGEMMQATEQEAHEVRQHLDRVVENRPQLPENSPWLQARARKCLAKLCIRTGQHTEAAAHLAFCEANFAAVERGLRRSGEPEYWCKFLVGTHFNRAELMMAQGDPSAAVPILRDEVVATYLRRLGNDHRDTLAGQRMLADALHRAGDVQGARRILGDILPRAMRVLGPTQRDGRRIMELAQHVGGVQGGSE